MSINTRFTFPTGSAQEEAPGEQNADEGTSGQTSLAGDPQRGSGDNLEFDPVLRPYFELDGSIGAVNPGMSPIFLVKEDNDFPVNFTWTYTEGPENPVPPLAMWIANENGEVTRITESSPIQVTEVNDGTPTVQRREFKIRLELNMKDGVRFAGQDMFLVLQYENLDNPDEDLFQVSPVFSVTDDPAKLTDLTLDMNDRLKDQELQDGFVIARPKNQNFQGGPIVADDNFLLPEASLPDPSDPDSTGKPTTAQKPSGLPSAAGGDTGASSIGGSKSDGLPTGAKIGIGVGCAIAGLLILSLIAFLVFRRRQRRSSSDHVRTATAFDGPPRGAINDYMIDKEMNGPTVAESPYSEDGRGSALLANQEFESRSFAPYSDAAPGAAAPHAITADTRIDSRASARSASPDRTVMPATVAHLVEDGMTEEQIRRLEEEERALDRAIEQAGHRNR